MDRGGGFWLMGGAVYTRASLHHRASDRTYLRKRYCMERRILVVTGGFPCRDRLGRNGILRCKVDSRVEEAIL